MNNSNLIPPSFQSIFKRFFAFRLFSNLLLFLKFRKNKNKIKDITFLIFIAIVSNSCNIKRHEDQLLLKVQRLEDENTSLKKQLNSLSFSPIVIPRSKKIKLGEEYIADIGLVVTDTILHPIVVLGKCPVDLIQPEYLGDTLKYSTKFDGSLYQITPTSRGKYKWCGIVFQKFLSKQNRYGFSVEYEVY